MTDQPPSPSPRPEVVLLPGARFFVRRIPLEAGADVAAQVELALEAVAPFPVDQLYFGHVVAPARDAALVFAAYRKQFSADEQAAWADARAVVPAFLALSPPASAAIRTWRDGDALTVAAWNGSSPLPVAVVARSGAAAADASAVVADLRSRAGLAAAPVEAVSGAATAAWRADGKALELRLAGAPAIEVDPTTADIRDKVFLLEQRRTGRRDQVLWRALASCLMLGAALVVLELGLAGAGLLLGRARAEVASHAAAVERIATAQSLGERIEALADRRLLPFEMLAVLNRVRPPSINFVRVTTTDRLVLEVEAQTANATDVVAYETALRAVPALATVETRDLRSRDGQTSFVLAATFKAGALAAGGGR